jgi:hypothetical protein
MSTERTQHRLSSQTSANNVNTDTYLKINMVGNERLLPTNQINEIVDVAKRFDTERERCTFYRIIGTINPLVSNTLFNLNDPNNNNLYTYAGFNENLFLDRSYPRDQSVNDDEDLTYNLAINTFLKEKDGWFGYYDPNIASAALCNYFDMEPKRERFSFLPDYHPFVANPSATLPNFVKNWELTITYPVSADTKHKMVYDTTNGNGLLIVDDTLAVQSTRNMTALGMACKHNLEIGDTVRIFGTNGYNGDHVVIRTGLDDGKLKDYYFVIDLPNTGSISNTSRMRKIVNDVESEYYFRLFTKIKTKNSPVIETDDYETYQAGFSENFFNDQIIQFVFNEDIDVSDLTDNLNRPLSELYLTMIKTDSNFLFTQVKSGIEPPFIFNLTQTNTQTYLRDVPVINRIHNAPLLPYVSNTPLENNVQIGNQFFYGDLVEFNKTTLIETVLADVHHRFNTINRQTAPTMNMVIASGLTSTVTLGPRQEGYYYKAHHLIKIREFSNYIEEGEASVDELPIYSIKTSVDSYIWRDLLPIGFNESEEKPLDYPFLNNSHYMYQNYCFDIKRQDPYGLWGLFYDKYPSDASGDRITDKFIVNSADDVC